MAFKRNPILAADSTFSSEGTQQGGGGGTPNNHPLPQYYSRRVLDERVSLPQDAKSNAVAIEVLNDTHELEKRLAKGESDYTDMLEQTDHMLKQVAVYVESQQIYNVVRTIEAKVQARRDAEIARLSAAVQEIDDDREFQEIIDLI
jgi:virulence-associated protein VapD